MAASIRSTRNFITPIDDASRDDLVVADVVTVQALEAATTYAWSLVFVPEGSATTFSGVLTAVSPGSFTVDLPGPYLVRLIVDAGLDSESTQYVRLRALTSSLGLKLVAAGERRDASGIIPVDVDPEGWANEQNANLQALETAAITADPLADVLAAGNTTGGTDVVVTTGDEIQGQTTLTLRADNNAADNIDMYPGAAGAVIVNGKLTVTGIIDPIALEYDETADRTTDVGKGVTWVSDGSGAYPQGAFLYRYESGDVVDLTSRTGNIVESTLSVVTVAVTDSYVLVNAAAAAPVAVNLPDGTLHATGLVVIKDKSGDAGGARPITVNAFAGQTIDGAATHPLTNDYAAATLVFSGTEWSVT